MTLFLPLTLAVALVGLVRSASHVLAFDDLTFTAEEITADLIEGFERGGHKSA